MNLIFLGPPGAGKGTQAQKLCWEYGLSQISTGDLLRSHIARKTPIGLEADKYINDGHLVSDELIIEMIGEELTIVGDSGYLLDGFPRTVPQAISLDKMLEKLEQKIDAVIVLEVPADEIVARLTARRTCPECGRSYHLIFNPPAKDGLCDLDNAELYQRKDDNEETVKRRQQIYEESTKPIIDYYLKQNLAYKLNGLGRMDDVFNRIKEIITLATKS
jgi:adenylate kinase